MLMTTTNNVEGKRILHYYGIVSGETIIGANMFRDLFASIRDIVGGRAGSYEEVLRQAKDSAMKEMCDEAMRLGANAVIGGNIWVTENVAEGEKLVQAKANNFLRFKQ